MIEFSPGQSTIVGDELRRWEKSAVTGRGLEEYLRNMHLHREDLIGKLVLDVGAGAANFARDVQAEHLNIRVISLDPDFSLSAQKRAERRNRAIGWRGSIEPDIKNSVAGIAEQTPFGNVLFDLVLAGNSVPEYFPTDHMSNYQERFYNMLEEFDRILKPGGEIRIFPNSIHIESQDDSYEELPYEKAALADFLSSHSYDVKSIPLDDQEDEWKAALVLSKPRTV